MADADSGSWLGRVAWLLARLRNQPRDPYGNPLRKPYVRRQGRYTSLQFSRKQTQSRMLSADPDQLLIDYTRTMLAALVLHPDPRTVCMVGLGGGSQAKFIHRHLPNARLEVVENNPQVIALREHFSVPPDGDRLQVVLDDGARFLRGRAGRYDLLLVDAYDARGIPDALATQAFYDDCRRSLAPGGAMATNLYNADIDLHMGHMRGSFGDRVLLLDEPRMSNRVAFGWTGVLPEPLDPARGKAGLAADAADGLALPFGRLAAALEGLDTGA